MAARKIISFFTFLLITLVVAGYVSPKSFASTRVMSTNLKVYFVDQDKLCSEANRKTNIDQAGQKTLNLCVSGPNYQSLGFDVKVTCAGVVECDEVEGGSDIGMFMAPGVLIGEYYFKKESDGTLAGKLIMGLTWNAATVRRAINIAKFKVNVTGLETGEVLISSSDIFLNDQDLTADVTKTNVTVGARSPTTPDPTQAPFSGCNSDQVPDGSWIPDADVTFAGKMASRSADFLNWVLERYQWSEVSSGTTTNPFTSFWKEILNIIYAFAVLLILISAFVMIWTRGQSITIMRFVPRFVIILVLATFSFTLIKFLYQFTDIIQGFFLRRGDVMIDASSLINMDFGYKDFVGYRLSGSPYDESVFITVLLTKLTALSYYIMSGVLLIRKVILWFFIIISPVFPLLLLYPTIRSTAKIWIGEFFRWLLYAPIFAILLSGLTTFWENYIPLSFKSSSGEALYPTATNLLLGGPGQNVSQGNSINQPDTFILYIICLLMVWIVIILPFILLRVFLDYVSNASFAENSRIKKVINSNFPYLEKYGIKGSNLPPSIPPVSPTITGMARSLPFISKLNLPTSIFPSNTNKVNRESSITQHSPTISNLSSNFSGKAIGSQLGKGLNINSRNTFIQNPSIKGGTFFNVPGQQFGSSSNVIDRTKGILGLANIKVPTIRDIAHLETSIISRDTNKQQEVKGIFERLEKIVNPSIVNNTSEIHQYNTIRDQLIRESSNNNVFAKAVLNAASKVAETRQTNQVIERVRQLENASNVGTSVERQRYLEVKNNLIKESNNNNSFAQSVLSQVNTISTAKLSKEKQESMTSSLIEKLTAEKEKGNTLASTVLQSIAPSAATSSLAKSTSAVPTSRSAVLSNTQSSAKVTAFPVVNRVQTVSLDDYEAVKEMWTENYQKLEVPQKMDGTQITREEWINSDIEKITEINQLLISGDQQKEKEGLDMVGDILPFLLIGGFSQTEIIAYLKAKLQAAKGVLSELDKQQEEEETKVEVGKREEQKQKEMTVENSAENIVDELKDQSAKIKT